MICNLHGLKGGCLLLIFILFCNPISKVINWEKRSLLVGFASGLSSQLSQPIIWHPMLPLPTTSHPNGVDFQSPRAWNSQFEDRAVGEVAGPTFSLFCYYSKSPCVYIVPTLLFDSFIPPPPTGTVIVVTLDPRENFWFESGLWLLMVNNLRI